MSDGAVQGMPGGILRLEGAALLVASVLAKAQFGQGWGLFAVLILAPDLSMIGYLRDPKLGAMVYNLAHMTVLPLTLLAVGWNWSMPLAVGLALTWLAHIGMDRAVGYGLKYNDAFKHTHLGG